MMRILLWTSFWLMATPALAQDRLATIDGDTFDLNGERIRIANMDAPETHEPHCDAEMMLGLVAAARLDGLLRSGPIVLHRGDPVDGRLMDKHKRTLATVEVDGRDVALILIDENLARPWVGRRMPWCD